MISERMEPATLGKERRVSWLDFFSPSRRRPRSWLPWREKEADTFAGIYQTAANRQHAVLNVVTPGMPRVLGIPDDETGNRCGRVTV